MKKQLIDKLLLNVDYKEFKINEVITFDETKESQREAVELLNSGIARNYE